MNVKDSFKNALMLGGKEFVHVQSPIHCSYSVQGSIIMLAETLSKDEGFSIFMQTLFLCSIQSSYKVQASQKYIRN
jgi:hypothetical protein